MGVSFDQVTVTCDECRQQLRLKIVQCIPIDVVEVTSIIKVEGWYASANCSRILILCPDCIPIYMVTDFDHS